MLVELVCVFLAVACLLAYIRTEKRKGKVPDGPKGLPIFGSILEIDNETIHHKFLEYAEKYGEIFRLKMMSDNVIVLNTEELIHKAFGDEKYKRFFGDRAAMFYGEHFRCHNQSLAFVCDGSGYFHRTARKSFVQAIHTYGSGLQELEDNVMIEMANLVKRIENKAGQEIECMSMLQRSLSNILSLVNMNAADLLKTHVTGVINHGHGGLHTFVDICQYSHDPNLTLNVLLKIFLSTSEKCGNRLPATLYLQADNCFRENKNKFVLAFCELLVRCEIFSEVHLSFLIVGHTHEDVDCAFSKISETLRKKDAETLEELLALLPETALLGNMLDVKGWLAPAVQDVSGVSRPLHCKFSKVEQAVSTSYKGRHDQPWIQLGGNFLSYIPEGKPLKLEPDYSNIDCAVQLRQVESLQHMYQKPSTLHKWRQLYQSIEDGTFEDIIPSEETWILDHLPRQRQREQFISVIPEVIQLLQRETEEPEIRFRKRVQQTGHSTSVAKKARTNTRIAER